MVVDEEEEELQRSITDHVRRDRAARDSPFKSTQSSLFLTLILLLVCVRKPTGCSPWSLVPVRFEESMYLSFHRLCGCVGHRVSPTGLGLQVRSHFSIARKLCMSQQAAASKPSLQGVKIKARKGAVKAQAKHEPSGMHLIILAPIYAHRTRQSSETSSINILTPSQTTTLTHLPQSLYRLDPLLNS